MALRASPSPTAPSFNLLESPLIAVLRAQLARDYAPVVHVLAAAGIRSLS